MNVLQNMEKCREFNIPVVICFIDCTKIFDWVNWKKLFEVLREMGVQAHVVDLVESLYGFNSLVVRGDAKESEAFQAEEGMRQGCILSRN